jgi:hypothetical protein
MLKLEENILKLLSLIMFFGSAIYYIYKLNWIGIIITLIISSLAFYLTRDKNKPEEPISAKRFTKIQWLPISYLLITLLAIFVLINNTSSQALISPWLVVPKYFFVLYFLVTGFLFFILTRNLSEDLKTWLLRIHYFLSFSVAVIIYQIGYGFDPFIHQATMELIDKQGYVDPKTPYYLGQYSLVTIIHKISGISIYLLNKFLVPILAALFIPGAILKFVNRQAENNKTSWIIILSLLAIPFNIFILSTPQNLSYLWLILVIFYSLTAKNNYFIFILGLAALAIHPLAGMPIIFFIGWQQFNNHKEKINLAWQKVINLFLYLGAILSLPLSFTLVTNQSWKDLSLSFDKLFNLFQNKLFNTNIADVTVNFPYLVNNIWLPVFIILTVSGFIYWLKENKKEATVFIKIISALVISFLLSASLSFSFLIDYERDNYISRLPIIMGIFALPAIIIALKNLTGKIYFGKKEVWLAAWIIITLFISSSIYLSYPRLDAYTNSRGYSVSEADLKAVNLIAEKSEGKYIVLANQQTSVASLKELGFDNYFDTKHGKIFFYPIPTGGELYQYYLKMVNEKPTRETMQEAMNLVGVKESYFVISKYWWFSNRIIAAAKINADTYWTINDGEIYIFKFSY